MSTNYTEDARCVHDTLDRQIDISRLFLESILFARKILEFNLIQKSIGMCER